MKIKYETPFPTVGEVVQAVFRWTGLWNFLSESNGTNTANAQDMKTVQKELQRFAVEETIICPDSIMRMVHKSVSEVLKNEALSKFAERSMILFLLSYLQEVRDNATWLDRKSSSRWFLYTRGHIALFYPVQRMTILSNRKEVRQAILLPNEPWWFLPGPDDNGVWKTPIQKVIIWWMLDNNYLTAESLEKAVGKKGYVSAVAVRSWIKGDAIPQISTLQVIMDAELNLGPDEEKRKRSLMALVVLARLINSLYELSLSLLGEEDAKSLFLDFKTLYMAYHKTERITFLRMLPDMLAKLGTDEENASADDLLDGERAFREHVLHPKIEHVFRKVNDCNSIDFVTSDDFVSELARISWKRGTAEKADSLIQKLHEIQIIVNKTRLLGLLMIHDNTIQQLDEACRALPPGAKANYMMTTVRARQAVCLGDCETAFTLYVEAFQEARYCGGKLVKKICEELMALCCFRHAMACEHRKQRGEYWRVAKYLRTWCKLALISPDFSDDNDEIYVEKGRRFFMRLMGNPESL